MQDVRWEQRFDNYQRALDQLNEAADIAKQRAFSDLEKQGLIQGFEYTYELAWKTLKDFLEYRGQTEILGSKDAFRKAFSLGVLEEGEVWMDMIKSRNRTAHTYNKQDEYKFRGFNRWRQYSIISCHRNVRRDCEIW